MARGVKPKAISTTRDFCPACRKALEARKAEVPGDIPNFPCDLGEMGNPSTLLMDTAGRAYLFTSFDAATGGNVVNQVQDAFNGLGQLTAQYQSHQGAVATSTTPKVQYAHTEMAGGQNNCLTSMTYPNGRVVDYVYNAGLDSSISRLSAITSARGHP